MFVHEWRKSQAKGEIYIVRYADDFVIGCAHKEDAEGWLDLNPDYLLGRTGCGNSARPVL